MILLHSSSLRRSRAIARRVGLLACLSLPAACASTVSTETATTEAPLFSPAAKVLETPLVHSDALQESGLVAISALCDYYGIELTPDARAEIVSAASDPSGLSGAELRGVLEAHTLEVVVFKGVLGTGPQGLKHHVDRGRPLLVMTAGTDANYYCLFVGYDPSFDNVVLLDPLRGRVIVPTDVFERAWERAQRFTLLALPDGGAGEEGFLSQSYARNRY